MAKEWMEQEMAKLPKGSDEHLVDRLASNDTALVRLDITASTLIDFNNWELSDFIQVIKSNFTVKSVHLSGDGLEDLLTPEQTDTLIRHVGMMPNIEELYVFRGNNEDISGRRIGQCVQAARQLKVFMIWGFNHLEDEPDLAGALRHHTSLERVTITLPPNMKYASLDVYAMGLVSMPHLKCLCIRCKYSQREPIFSPEAITILLSSTSIKSMYLENCGLVDDHSDAIAHELPTNKVLTLLDLKHNLFTDDALFTFAQYLKRNRTLRSLDLSGVYISEDGVYALAETLKENKNITHLELEGTADRYQDEFDVPDGHSNTPYMEALHFQLRLNRRGRQRTALNL